MKLKVTNRDPGRGTAGKAHAGFTIAEMLIAIAVFLLLVSGILGANLFGLRMYQVNENKLKATDEARKAIGKMTDEIRACKSTWLGTVSNGVFVARLDGEVQTGGGVLIYPSTNTANFIMYFVNPSDKSFRRTTSAPAKTTVLAHSVTNTTIFSAQDYLGNVLSNNQNSRVIHMCLEFFQPPRAGSVAADYYKLETSVTRRALE